MEAKSFANLDIIIIVVLVIFSSDNVYGLSLNLNIDNTKTANNLPACQLVCEDLSLRPANTGDNINTSGDKKHKGALADDGSQIERMTLFKNSQNTLSILAEISSTNNIVSRVDHTTSVEGLLSTGIASVHVDFFDHLDCQAGFTCQVFLASGQVEVRELTTAQSGLGTKSITSSSTYALTTTPAIDLPTTSLDGLTSDTSEYQITTPAIPLTTASADVLKAPNPDDMIAKSDQSLDLTPHLLGLIEDMKSEMAILQAKADEPHFIEQRLTAQIAAAEKNQRDEVARLSGQLTAAERRLNDAFTTRDASVQNDILSAERRLKDDFTAQVTSLEQHIEYAIETAEMRIRDEISNTEQSQKLEISATEQRLTVRMSEIEKDVQPNCGQELSQLEAKLDLAIHQSDDASSCSEDLKDDIMQTKTDVLHALSYNMSVLSNAIVSNIEENYNTLVNVSSDLENRFGQVFNFFMSFNQTLENRTCIQNMARFTESITQEIKNISCISEESQSVLKDLQCMKGMSLLPALPSYPYPVLYPDEISFINKPYLCDTSGGWIVVQRRESGNVSFYRGWEEYKAGFGSLDDDFWLGLDAIHKLTTSARFELLIDLKYNGQSAYALYSTFSVGSESDNYRLSVGGYSGTAGDSLTGDGKHNGMEFSTKDRDNDNRSSTNCAVEWTGAWWYNGCHRSNLNGQWLQGGSKGLEWFTFTSTNSATFSEMKIRKVTS